ncbi:hypothetical protein MLD38_038247 [Melastoma candidum]|uniref:Uncharacterized protein n=1 Tax=Melastoma candidum TaxID=119954 RepID=A0ACB9KZH6_9MYRT|nr:hypothetical protein MLD38_038247 [Melastoma candidum]
MASAGSSYTVCVTGASGYIASWLVKLLLQRGYSVRATVRNPDDPRKTAHLMALDGARERLRLFKAELLEEGAFDSAVAGCDGVFHTASPVFFTAADPKTELIDPAVEGTLNVLRSCSKAPSIKRIVLTSSIAAVSFNGKPLTSDVLVDETWFSDPKFCEETKIWYILSKTLAERAAWEFAEENRLNMVTINPGLVIGPLLQPTVNATAEIIFNLVNGAKTFPNTCYRFVDVRDVANAHILAYENPSASGRYCLAGRAMHIQDVVKVLHDFFPTLNLPDKCEDDKSLAQTYQVSKTRAEGLGVSFTPIEISIRDTVDSLKEKGLLEE